MAGMNPHALKVLDAALTQSGRDLEVLKTCVQRAERELADSRARLAVEQERHDALQATLQAGTGGAL